MTKGEKEIIFWFAGFFIVAITAGLGWLIWGIKVGSIAGSILACIYADIYLFHITYATVKLYYKIDKTSKEKEFLKFEIRNLITYGALGIFGNYVLLSFVISELMKQ
mgnify:CR=1 FL=1